MKYRTSWGKECFLRHMPPYVDNFKQHFVISPSPLSITGSAYVRTKLIQTFSRNTIVVSDRNKINQLP